MPSIIAVENANVTQDIADKLISQSVGFNELLVIIEDRYEDLITFIENEFDGTISARLGFYPGHGKEHLTLFFDITAPSVSEEHLDEYAADIDAYVSQVARKFLESLDAAEDGSEGPTVAGHEEVKTFLKEVWQLSVEVTLNGEQYEL